MESIPVETLEYILSFINERENYLSINLVCKNFFEISETALDYSVDDNFAIRWSCTHGKLELTKKLLRHNNVDPGARDNEAIRLASANGHHLVVQELIKDKRVDPTDCSNYAFRFACMNGHIEVVKILNRYARYDQSGANLCSLNTLMSNGHRDIIKFLIEKNPQLMQVFTPVFLHWAMEEGHIDIVKPIIEGKFICISSSLIKTIRDEGLKIAYSFMEKDDAELWEVRNFMIQLDRRFKSAQEIQSLLNTTALDPEFTYNFALKVATTRGNLEVVKSLLASNRVDPFSISSAAMIAGFNCDKDIVQEFINDRRVNKDDLMGYACHDGNPFLVRELLKCNGVDPSKGHNFSIRHACKNGHLKIVKQLLKHETVDPTESESESFIVAMQYKHFDIVKELLKDNRVNPAVHDNLGIKEAIKNGCLELVMLLLQDNRVDPLVAYNFAEFNQCTESIKKLLRDHRILGKRKVTDLKKKCMPV